MVSIPACHTGDRGSIPRRRASAANKLQDPHRTFLLNNYYSYSMLNTKLPLTRAPCWAPERTMVG